jgi:hypothetical protein
MSDNLYPNYFPMSIRKVPSVSVHNCPSLGALEEATNIFIHDTDKFTANILKTADYISLQNVSDSSFPSLVSVGNNIDADNCRTFKAENLEQVGGSISSPTAESVSLPRLKTVGRFLALEKTERLNVPELESLMYLWGNNIRTLYAPQLKYCDELMLPQIGKLDLPALKTAKHIQANTATKVLIPNVISLQTLLIPEAKDAAIDAIQQVTVEINIAKMEAPFRQIFPRLSVVGSAWSDSSVVLIVSEHLREQIITEIRDARLQVRGFINIGGKLIFPEKL